MKRFLTILFTTLLLAAALCVTASASAFDGAAEDLAAIGMFRGTANGFELDRAPTRGEAAIMLVRLYGAEDAAKAAYEAGEIKHPFTDVSSTAAPYVAWVYTNGISNGTSATAFGSSNKCTSQNYLVFLLRALGYKDGTDFQYSDAETFAMSKGLFDVSSVTGSFLRDDLAALTYQALACELADGSTYLLDSLVKSGAIDAVAAKPITEKIENLRALQNSSDVKSMDVSFSMKMDIATAMKGKTDGQPIDQQMATSMTASGAMQMKLDDGKLEMGMKMNADAIGEKLDVGMWIKDNWLYMQSGETMYKQDLGNDMAEFLKLYQEIMEHVDVNAGCAMLLPYIDAVTAQKQGSNTVYTLTLNDSLVSMVDDIVKEALAALGEDAPEMKLYLKMDKCAFVYTLNSRGELKKADADFSFMMQADAAEDADNSLTVSASIGLDMDMTVNAIGDRVKVSYPDLSRFEDIEAIMQASPEPPSVNAAGAA